MIRKTVSLFMLACVCAASAFAQVTFSGEANMGIQLTNPPDADETITTTHREYGSPRFDLSATVIRDNYGARLVTRFQNREGMEPLEVRGIYGWVDWDGLAGQDDSLRLSMGQFASGLWVIQLDSDIEEFDIDRITGFRLTYDTPIQGLSVGAAFRSTGQDAEAFGEQMIFGGTLITPLFSALFVYDLGWNVRTLFGINFPGFGFIGLPDLSFGFKIRADRLATWDSSTALGGQMRMYQRIGYRISWPVSVSLIAGQRIYARNNTAGDDMWMMFGPGITYRHRSLPNLTASLRAMIDSADHFSTQNLIIRPAIEKSLAGPAIFYVQYQLNLDDFGSSNPMDRATHTISFGLDIRAF
ncbi:MAG: hypothetical protein FWC65_06360 [Treponema sp.]|nr:hypothetical protein [Treponema sp.]